jgi:hypothetical protein
MGVKGLYSTSSPWFSTEHYDNLCSSVTVETSAAEEKEKTKVQKL